MYKKMSDESEIKYPIDTNSVFYVEGFNDCPITVLEVEDQLWDKGKEIMSDYLDGDDAEEMLEQLRSLRTEGVVTENLYDFIIENWDDILSEIEGK